MAARPSRTSRTRRASGPCTDMIWPVIGRSSVALALNAGTRPRVGRIPATPQQ
jgi:hypothetical protein